MSDKKEGKPTKIVCAACYSYIDTRYVNGKARGECPDCQEPYSRKEPSMEIIDLSDWMPRARTSFNEYELGGFNLMDFHEVKYVWYGEGAWTGHIMDWRGLNIFHGRLPKSPVFNNKREAILWLQVQLEAGVYYKGQAFTGHHAGDGVCSKCGDREEGTYAIYDLIPSMSNPRIGKPKPIKCKYRFKKNIPWF